MSDSRLAAQLAAVASVGAAVIHFSVAPAHWQDWVPAGLFFVVVGACQLFWACAVLVRTTPSLLVAGILLNVGAISLWALSRTAGTPFGSHPGEPELVQAADLCALLLQVYVVMGAGWVGYRGLRGEPVPAFAGAAVLLGAIGVVAAASAVGVTSGLRHGEADAQGPESDHSVVEVPAHPH